MSKTIFSKDHKYLIGRLRKARIESGLSQKHVSDMLGRTQSYISKLESNQRRIDVVQLKELARIYKKPIEYFLEEYAKN